MATKSSVMIGITDCQRYENYDRWFKAEPGVTTVRLSYQDNNLSLLDNCDGVVLSGGEDVHPRFYNKKEYISYCQEIDERRDDFEWKVLEEIEHRNLPLFGICRGLQMTNVYFGGTLVPDLPSFGRFNHAERESRDRHHNIVIDPESALYNLTGQESGRVNSAHHQSADHVGKGLVANCFSADGVVEGLERLDSGSHPFFLLVQWHPERMTDQRSKLSGGLKRKFIDAVRETTQ